MNFDNGHTMDKDLRKPRLQFLCCTTASCILFLQGIWTLLEGTHSVTGQIGGPLTAVLWLTIPSLAYYAWQGYRRMTAR